MIAKRPEGLGDESARSHCDGVAIVDAQRQRHRFTSRGQVGVVPGQLGGAIAHAVVAGLDGLALWAVGKLGLGRHFHHEAAEVGPCIAVQLAYGKVVADPNRASLLMREAFINFAQHLAVHVATRGRDRAVAVVAHEIILSRAGIAPVYAQQFELIVGAFDQANILEGCRQDEIYLYRGAIADFTAKVRRVGKHEVHRRLGTQDDEDRNRDLRIAANAVEAHRDAVFRRCIRGYHQRVARAGGIPGSTAIGGGLPGEGRRARAARDDSGQRSFVVGADDAVVFHRAAVIRHSNANRGIGHYVEGHEIVHIGAAGGAHREAHRAAADLEPSAGHRRSGSVIGREAAEAGARTGSVAVGAPVVGISAGCGRCRRDRTVKSDGSAYAEVVHGIQIHRGLGIHFHRSGLAGGDGAAIGIGDGLQLVVGHPGSLIGQRPEGRAIASCHDGFAIVQTTHHDQIWTSAGCSREGQEYIIAFASHAAVGDGTGGQFVDGDGMLRRRYRAAVEEYHGQIHRLLADIIRAVDCSAAAAGAVGGGLPQVQQAWIAAEGPEVALHCRWAVH